MPLNTRAGVADAPIDPGARTLCEPWLTGPRLKLCRLIVPAKPLPLERPLTLICSPGSNGSTVTRVADGQALGVADLDQVAVRPGAGLLQVADLGLLMRLRP